MCAYKSIQCFSFKHINWQMLLNPNLKLSLGGYYLITVDFSIIYMAYVFVVTQDKGMTIIES